MKKTLRLFFVAVLAMVVGNVMAETSTLTFTAKCNGAGTANDGTAWTITSDGTESNFDTNKGIHYGTGSAAVQYIKLSTSAILGTITKVVVNASVATGVTASVDVKVGGAAFGGDAQSLSATATDYSFTGSAEGEIVVNVSKPSSANKALYVKSVEVTYTPAAGTVSAPKFSVEQGMYFESQQVELTCSTEGANIFYTTDGTEPDEGATKYTAPISVTANTTIKAVAIKDSKASAVVTAEYTIINTTGKGTAASPFSVADALLIVSNLASGATTSSAVYTKGIVVGDVTVNANGQAKFTIGATASATDNLITVYQAKGLENEAYVAGDTKAGDEVVICAPLQNYGGTTPETQYGYIYSINGETSKAAPTLEGDGSETNPFTANDLIIMKTSQRPTGAVWVKGIIKGTYKSKTELDIDKASNIAIATSATATEYAPVELKTGSVFREKLNVVDNSGNKEKEVLLKGTIDTYFGATGVKDLVEAKLDGAVITGINDVKVVAAEDENAPVFNLAGQKVNANYYTGEFPSSEARLFWNQNLCVRK